MHASTEFCFCEPFSTCLTSAPFFENVSQMSRLISVAKSEVSATINNAGTIRYANLSTSSDLSIVTKIHPVTSISATNTNISHFALFLCNTLIAKKNNTNNATIVRLAATGLSVNAAEKLFNILPKSIYSPFLCIMSSYQHNLENSIPYRRILLDFTRLERFVQHCKPFDYIKQPF